jgi:hypothetical protein
MHRTDDEIWVIETSPHDTFEKKGRTRGDAQLHQFRGDLVLLQDSSSIYDAPEDILERYINLVPNPVEVTIYQTLELAQIDGYVAPGFYTQHTYNVIVKGSTENQIWLFACPDSTKDISKKPTMKQILTQCGLNLSTKESSSHFKQHQDWLESMLRVFMRSSIILHQ